VVAVAGIGAVAAFEAYDRGLLKYQQALETERNVIRQKLAQKQASFTRRDNDFQSKSRSLEAEIEKLRVEKQELRDKLDRRWQEFMDQANKKGVSPEELIKQMRTEFASNELANEADREVEALFAEIESLAQNRQVEELIGKFTELRAVMQRYGKTGSAAVRAKRAKWNKRLAAFGEVQLSIQLQIFINEGNQHLRGMAEAIKEKKTGLLHKNYGDMLALCDQMGQEEREVFHRNANALFLRGRALAIRAGGVPGVVAEVDAGEGLVRLEGEEKPTPTRSAVTAMLLQIEKGDLVMVFGDGPGTPISSLYPDHPEHSPVPAIKKVKGTFVRHLRGLEGEVWLDLVVTDAQQVAAVKRFTITKMLASMPAVLNFLMSATVGQSFILEIAGKQVRSIGTEKPVLPPRGSVRHSGIFSDLKVDGEKRWLILISGREELLEPNSHVAQLAGYLRQGQRVQFWTRRGLVVGLETIPGIGKQRTGRFLRIDTVGKHRILMLEGGDAGYLLHPDLVVPKAIQKPEAIAGFALKKGDVVHFEVRRAKVVSLR
jgi:hypothetical protein